MPEDWTKGPGAFILFSEKYMCMNKTFFVNGRSLWLLEGKPSAHEGKRPTDKISSCERKSHLVQADLSSVYSISLSWKEMFGSLLHWGMKWGRGNSQERKIWKTFHIFGRSLLLKISSLHYICQHGFCPDGEGGLFWLQPGNELEATLRREKLERLYLHMWILILASLPVALLSKMQLILTTE